MSDLISETDLRALITSGEVIQGGLESGVEGVKYDFRMGKRILLPGRRPIDVTQLPEQERAKLFLNPGSLAYVLTEERLVLPRDVKAELSPKRKLSQAGILVLGGFCIDPGYAGRLLVGLLNFSSTPFPIEPGRKLIAAQFYRLAQPEIPPARAQEAIDEFPDDLVRLMQTYEPMTLEGVRLEIVDLQQALQTLREEFTTKEKWFSEFREFLERHEKQIERLTEGLRVESETRQKTDEDFRRDLKEVSRSTFFTSITVGVLSALVVGIIASVAAAFFFARITQK